MWGKNTCGQLGLGKSKYLFRYNKLRTCYLRPNSSSLLSFYLHVRFHFYIFSYEDAARVVHVPTKVEALNGITIKSVALGSEHSVAVTGTDPRFLNTCFFFFCLLSIFLEQMEVKS